MEELKTEPTPYREKPREGPRDGGAAAPLDRFPELRGEVQEIDLYSAFQRLRAGRRVLLRTVAVFVVAGLVFALASRKEYETGATLLPEKQDEGGLSAGAGLGLLQQFGGLLGGINPGNLFDSGSAIPVQLYPEILRSTPVLLEMLEQPVYVTRHDTTVRLFTYLDDYKPFSPWELPGQAVSGLASAARSLFGGAPPAAHAPEGNVVRLTEDQARVLKDLRERVQASLDKKTGALSVTVRMPDPNVAAQTADAAVEQMTAYIRAYRLRKLNEDLAFIEERHREARTRFNAALDQLARFRDRNQHLARDLARTEEQRLQAEFDLAFNVYNSLSSHLEESRIRVQEQTPVFQILQPVSVPLKKSTPQTLLVLLLSVLLGVAAGAALVLRPARHRRT